MKLALTSLTWRPQVSWLYDYALEGGTDMQQQHNNSERYRTQQRARLAQTRDQRFDFVVQQCLLKCLSAVAGDWAHALLPLALCRQG